MHGVAAVKRKRPLTSGDANQLTLTALNDGKGNIKLVSSLLRESDFVVCRVPGISAVSGLITDGDFMRVKDNYRINMANQLSPMFPLLGGAQDDRLSWIEATQQRGFEMVKGLEVYSARNRIGNKIERSLKALLIYNKGFQSSVVFEPNSHGLISCYLNKLSSQYGDEFGLETRPLIVGCFAVGIDSADDDFDDSYGRGKNRARTKIRALKRLLTSASEIGNFLPMRILTVMKLTNQHLQVTIVSGPQWP